MIGINKKDLFKLFYCMETKKLIKRGPESTAISTIFFFLFSTETVLEK